MKKVITVIACVLIALSAFASIDSKIIPITSSLYEDMDIVYSLAGKGTPSNSRPWSVSEAQMILSRVDRSSLGKRGQVLYDGIMTEINKETRWSLSSAGFGAELEINPEFYFHSNGRAFVSEDDWLYSFKDRKHIFTLNLDMNVGDIFYSYADLMYGYGKWLADDSGAIRPSDISWPDFADKNHIGTVELNNKMYVGVSSDLFKRRFTFNLPLQTKDFDFIWPRRALVSLGGKEWNFTVSRDRLSWGNSHIGNFVISPNESFDEYVKASFFSDMFKYDSAVVFFETAINNGEVPDTFSKMLLAHRLEFRLLERLTFSVSENVMYQAGQVGYRNLNPALIFHNLNNRSMFNAIAYADLDFYATKGLNIYAQYVLDQATAPNESDNQDTSWGLILGAEYTKEFNSFVYSSSFEGAITAPAMYRRDEVDFLYFTRTFVYGPSYVLQFRNIGFPYGGDAVVFDVRQSALFDRFGKLSLDLRAVFHGEMGIFSSHNINKDNTDYPNRKLTILSGDVTKTLSLSLKYEASLNSILEKTGINLGFVKADCFAECDLIGVLKPSSSEYDIQTSFGLSVSI